MFRLFLNLVPNTFLHTLFNNFCSNFTYYHLPIPEGVACDNSHPCWRSQQGLFDVILTDLASSEATRDALLAAIVQRSPAPRVVVMASSARESAGLGDLPRGTRFLAKPFGTGDLDAALRRPADPPPEAAS